MAMQKRTIFIILALCMVISACSTLRFPGVYRIDIPQGNFVTDDMVEQLDLGMTPEQVRYVMGAPTLTDPFTPDAWYYLMTYQPGQGRYAEQKIILHFDDARLSRVEGEVMDDFRARTRGQQERELEERARTGKQN